MSVSPVASSESRSSRLDTILTGLLSGAPELDAAAVVSFDGLPMASALPDGMDEDRVAAMSAALLSLGERAAAGLGRGELSQLLIEGDQGTVLLVSADDEAVLVAVAAADAKIGMVRYEARRAAAAVGAVLREMDPALPMEQPRPAASQAVAVDSAPAPVRVPDQPAAAVPPPALRPWAEMPTTQTAYTAAPSGPHAAGAPAASRPIDPSDPLTGDLPRSPQTATQPAMPALTPTTWS